MYWQVLAYQVETGAIMTFGVTGSDEQEVARQVNSVLPSGGADWIADAELIPHRVERLR